MMLPHWPFEPTPDSKEWDPAFRRGDAAEINKPPMRSQKYFIDMVAYTDKMVGKILAKLEEAGVRDNTLFIFTGDNGTYSGITSILNGEPYKGGKGKTTLNGTHVPLIVDWPAKAKAGSVVDDLVDVSDMLPTMLDAAGVPMSEGFEPDGRSFLPQVRGEAGNPRDWIYCWYARSGNANRAKEFAMTKRYKLYGDGKLFDLDNDFYEKSPITEAGWTDKQRGIAAKLRSVIEAHTRPKAPAAD